ncbi:MAG: peptidase C25 [Thermoplasmatales archaeon]|nr:MAG: peptidase C25 [Thermoplasmatales archaeon]
MKIHHRKREIVLIIAFILISLNQISVIGTNSIGLTDIHLSGTTSVPSESYQQYIKLEFFFSDPIVVVDGDHIWVYINESDLNMMIPGQPVLPVNLSVLEFLFGTEILSVEYDHSPPQIINLTGTLARASHPMLDDNGAFCVQNRMETLTYEHQDSFPPDWISYHIGGGLSHGIHRTFLVNRVYPVRYFPDENQLWFIQNITVTIGYVEPDEPLLKDNDVYDLLIIAPSKFTQPLQPLVSHKNKMGMKTRLVDLEELYETMFWQGRDNQEKIKYYIKNAVEYWGITYVLLVGGIKGQTFSWNTPVRYSHVIPLVEQEYAEPSFISDLYYADIYEGSGVFSSWDSNNDDVFAVWNETYKEEMDIYPDVYLGRIPCRNTREVKIMVNKIIQYEKEKCDDSWFNNLILVAGDSYNDTNHFNEGELIAEKAIEYMPDFNPVKVYASEGDINRKTVNKAMNKGAGFAYFCGHGNPASWTTHFPPNGSIWTTGYTIRDMMYLRNREKLPIVVVGGCHNSQFNVTMRNIIKGILRHGIRDYFRTKPPFGDFWYREWVPNCWAWRLTSKTGGGAIATIANTGLGTHGEDDSDNNSIADYLEVLDGWLELRFLQLYGEEHYDVLGENHGEALTDYLHRFLGNDEKMDVKMVQQWVLLGDPSIKIGGYK